MPTLRQERVRELLKRAIGEAIRREFNVSDVGLISVNDVDCPGDLKTAVVYVSILGNAAPAIAHAKKAGVVAGVDLVGDSSISNRPLILMTAMAGLALVPFVGMMVTSFVKIAVVLSITRQAIGTQQAPPTTVITARPGLK